MPSKTRNGMRQVVKTAFLAATVTAFQCEKPGTFDTSEFDFTSIASLGTIQVDKTLIKDPTKTIKSFHFNICSGLTNSPTLPCPTGTRICEVWRNYPSSSSDTSPENKDARIIYWQAYGSKDVDPTESLDPNKQLDLSWKGDKEGVIKLALKCDKTVTTGKDGLKWVEEDGKSYTFEWKSPAACAKGVEPKPAPPGSEPKKGTDPKPDNPKAESESSLAGTLFVIGFLSFTAYMLIGILYKRIVHNERGLDQLPHLDFWRTALFKSMDLWSACTGKMRSMFGGSRRMGPATYEPI